MVEAAATARALQGVGVLGGHIGILHDSDASASHLSRDVVGDVTGHIHVGQGVVVLDEDIVVGKRLVGDGHTVHIGKGEPLFEHSKQVSRGIRHRTHRFGVIGPMHMTRVDPHGLLRIAKNTRNGNQCCQNDSFNHNV